MGIHTLVKLPAWNGTLVVLRSLKKTDSFFYVILYIAGLVVNYGISNTTVLEIP